MPEAGSPQPARAHIALARVDALVFDFDGVLTDNRVLVDAAGTEWVRCSRADGLAFDVLRKIGVKTFIVSTERNPVVSARAAKLKVPVIQDVADKRLALIDLAEREGLELSRVLYVGNDLNDLGAMSACGLSACPADSHPRIKKVAGVVLQSPGGDGVARELVEDVFGLDIVKILYSP